MTENSKYDFLLFREFLLQKADFKHQKLRKILLWRFWKVFHNNKNAHFLKKSKLKFFFETHERKLGKTDL